jgi:hypothetical protein
MMTHIFPTVHCLVTLLHDSSLVLVEEDLLRRCEEMKRKEDDACKNQQAGSSGPLIQVA